jgi:putative endonuclease
MGYVLRSPLLFYRHDTFPTQMGNYSVYILFSQKLNRFYVGTTDDVERRLQEHNEGTYKDAFTSKGIPWVIFLTIDQLNSGQAYQIERKIKSQKSSRYIQNLRKYPEMIEKLKDL